MEEQKTKQDDRFLKGRQFAYTICDYCMISGAGEALLDLNDFSSVQLPIYNVQGFDTKWEEVLLSMTKVSDEDK